MLHQVRVRDYAIIDEVELELESGMTVLTGETGAGKSILVDALGLVLGDRADASAVRHGADRAEITAAFELSDMPAVARWLAEQDMDAEGECVVRRLISREGRSRAYVNGCSVTLPVLRTLGEMLVEIHGQHEHQTLTRRPVQRQLLDIYGGHEKQCDAVRSAFGGWQTARQRLADLQAACENRDDRLELLRYQVRELEALDLQPGEAAKLEAEFQKLANVERLAAAAAEACQLVYEAEDGSAHQALARARRGLETVVDVDPSLASAARLLEEAEIQATEAADELRRYLGDLEVDPGRQEYVAGRLNGIRNLSRKHGVDPDQLASRLDTLRRDLEELENTGVTLDAAGEELAEAESRYRQAAERLGSCRKQAAAQLAGEITAAMHELGMPGGVFEVRVNRADTERFSAHGLDSVEFLVSANPGQPAAPLAKVASGGELSRISLAVQVIATGASGRPCLIFDEVDAGIGGGVAEIVGRRLRELGDHHQVLCVTHLPQVASQSHQHIRVTKLTDGRRTRTVLTPLGDDEKVEELARMLGGVKVTDTSRRHAREMMTLAGKV
ncbi:MAG: DNA repair protein RecN [Gammaproteobacteria bacterium]|jgi:DNA repair protein RecN (Recombination protein N)